MSKLICTYERSEVIIQLILKSEVEGNILDHMESNLLLYLCRNVSGSKTFFLMFLYLMKVLLLWSGFVVFFVYTLSNV